MIAMRLRSAPGQQQREQRADAGRRQRREDRDRVDVALVEHAQHDVHRHDGREDQQQRAVERGAERLGRALEAGLDAGRHAELALRLLDGGDGRAERRAGPRLNESVTAGNWPAWLMTSGVCRSSTGAMLESGTCRPQRLPVGLGSASPGERLAAIGGRDVNLAERVGADLVSRRRLEHHAVLVGLRVDRRDQPLAERVVERVVDGRHADAQPAGRVAVDVQERLQPAVLQVARDVQQFGAARRRSTSLRHPLAQPVRRRGPP